MLSVHTLSVVILLYLSPIRVWTRSVVKLYDYLMSPVPSQPRCVYLVSFMHMLKHRSCFHFSPPPLPLSVNFFKATMKFLCATVWEKPQKCLGAEAGDVMDSWVRALQESPESPRWSRSRFPWQSAQTGGNTEGIPLFYSIGPL